MPHQHSAAAYAIMALKAALLLGSLAVWIRVLVRGSAGKPAVRFEPRRPVPWGLVDAAMVLAVWYLLMIVLSVFLAHWSAAGIEPGPAKVIAETRGRLLGAILAGLGSVAFGIERLAARGAQLADFGLSRRDRERDFGLGLVGFIAAVAPVYGVQSVLVEFWPSKHPLIEMVEKNPDPWTMAMVTVSAVLIAPIVEEFLFRLVLQGALEAAELRAVARMGHPAQVEDHASADPGQAETMEFAGQGSSAEGGAANEFGASAQRTNPGWPSIAPRESPTDDAGPTLAEGLLKAKVWGLPMGVWPMTISATLFALFHVGHGPDPIALLLLALILGYLYRQTHRLLPSIALHMAFNAFAMIMISMSAA